jgi:hypothetical protein
VIVVIVLAGWFLLGAALDSTNNTGKPPATGQSQSSPDRAKQQGGANGDTMPSPSGTGTGSSDHSILGQ